jgi:septum formation protein
MLSVAPSNRLVLASSSPRRRELLSSLGLTFDIVPSSADETVRSGESATAMVERLALEKARIVAQQYPDAWVIGADTTVVIDGKILGKPEDEKDAEAMLLTIQGRTQSVLGGLALVNLQKDIVRVESHESLVDIAPMTIDEIRRYVKSGEPMDKAGSYAVQGIGAYIVDKITGSYTNVVGLNLTATIRLLRDFEVVV